MDLGRPLNPGVDRGQVTGAFLQGMGWVTSENLVYNDKGTLLTHSPTTYKIPNIQSTPRIFIVDFVTNDDNDCNVHRSKAVGEPPLMLGISAFSAISDAIRGCAKSAVFPKLDAPATAERILMTIQEHKTL